MTIPATRRDWPPLVLGHTELSADIARYPASSAPGSLKDHGNPTRRHGPHGASSRGRRSPTCTRCGILGLMCSLVIAKRNAVAVVAAVVVLPVLAATLLAGCSGNKTTATSATIEGELVVVGGPYPGDARPTAGTVSINMDGKEVKRLDVPSSGKFLARVTPGVYTVDGSFSGYPCQGGSVSVARGQTTTLSVGCSIR
jgi:hypothetical protein